MTEERRGSDLTLQVTDLLEAGEVDALQRLLEAQPAEHLADLLEHAGQRQREQLFQLLSPALAGQAAAAADEAVREQLLEDVTPSQLAEMMAELPSEDAIDLLEEVPPSETEDVLRHLDPEDAGELREILGHQEDSAGREMGAEAPAVPESCTIGQALERLRREREAGELDEVETVFVVDVAGRLCGYLPLDLLLFADNSTPVTQVMRRDLSFVYTYEDRETAAGRARAPALLSLPVIDGRGVLRGQLTQSRLREIAEEESSEDMYRMVGLSEQESVFSPFGDSLRRRLPWLFLNLAVALVIAWVISIFEATIASLALLAALQTTVASQGGNVGVQTLTIVVRAMALGEVDWRNVRAALRKEVSLGLINGIVIGAATGALVYAWRGNLLLSVVLGLCVILNMAVAAATGFTIPILLRSMKRDPAQSSGVLVMAIADLFGFAVFLGLATLLLPYLLR